ncbi:MAG: ribose-5-phosphate isomerase RpiA [Methanomicrobiaceae archaeon]|nr:ribose-5-phosphate isomerase RpiA [Methanomicrobiaceae archaeon]
MTPDIDFSKKNAGYFAADLVQDGMAVGLGTGSTVFFAMERLSERISSEGLDITGIPTSFQATIRARDYGIPLSTLDDFPELDIAIDGADKIDSSLRLIKGRGAAQTLERCVADASELFIVVADESKMCDNLHGPVPVEVIPFALGLFEKRIRELGGIPTIRVGVKKDGPVITDCGNFEVDCDFGVITEPEQLQSLINNLPGVLSCGLFTEFTGRTKVVIGNENGVNIF